MMIVELVNPFTRPNLRLALAVASAGLLSTSGCAKDPSKDAPLAQVGHSKPATSSDALKQPARPPQTKDKEGIPLTGTIGFVGSKVTGSHEGIFKTWTGRVKLGKRIEDAAIRFEVDVASVFDPFRYLHHVIDGQSAVHPIGAGKAQEQR